MGIVVANDNDAEGLTDLVDMVETGVILHAVRELRERYRSGAYIVADYQALIAEGDSKTLWTRIAAALRD